MLSESFGTVSFAFDNHVLIRRIKLRTRLCAYNIVGQHKSKNALAPLIFDARLASSGSKARARKKERERESLLIFDIATSQDILFHHNLITCIYIL